MRLLRAEAVIGCDRSRLRDRWSIVRPRPLQFNANPPRNFGT